MLINIYMKFLEHILNRFQVTEQTRFCDGQSSKGNNSKSINARVMVMLIDIYMKFLEDSFNSFHVIEWTRFCNRVQGNHSKSIKARVMVLALCTLSNVD